MQKKYTGINEAARKLLDITRDEYAFCDYVLYRASDPRQSNPGWCCDGKEDIADFIGISRPGLYKMAKRLEGSELIEVSANGNYRASARFIDAANFESECKQSLQDGVNKVNGSCKQSLQPSVNKVNTHNIGKEGYKERKERYSASRHKNGSLNVNEGQSSPPPKVPPAPPENKKLIKVKDVGVVALPDSYTVVMAEIFDSVGETLGEKNGIGRIRHNWEASKGRDFAAMKSIAQMLSVTLLEKCATKESPKSFGPEVFKSTCKRFFELGFEYLLRIAQNKGEALTTYQPHVLKNNFNPIIQSAGAKPASTQKSIEPPKYFTPPSPSERPINPLNLSNINK